MIKGINLGNIMIDCDDEQKLCDFYHKLLGWEKCKMFGRPGLRSDTGIVFLFIEEEDYIPPIWPEEKEKQQKQMHFDFQVPDVESAVKYAISLGATKAAFGAKIEKKYPDLKCTVPEYCFIRYLDGEYKEKDIRVELCEAVDQKKPDFDDVVFKYLDPVKVVSVMHKGPYSRLGEAYAFAMKWIDENGYRVADAPRESYIDGIWNKDSEEEWLTEIQIPIETK